MAGSSMTFSLFGKDVSASKAIAGVGHTADKTGRGFAGTLGRGMKVAGVALASGAVLAGAGIAAGIAKGFGDAAEFEALQKQTEAVLKSTGNTAGTSVKGVQELAASLENLSGIDETLIINSQNVLATFTQVRNETGKGNKIFDRATKAALGISAALGTDLQGASVQVGKALNDPIKGISALTRVGVSFTDKQKEQIKALVESGDKMGAQKVILGELNKEFGNAAKAAGSGFNGAMARLQDTIGDTFRDIATNLLPIATTFVDWIRTSAIPWIKNLWGWFQEHLGPIIRRVGRWITETLIPALQDLVGWLRDHVAQAFQAISDWWDTSGRKMWESFSSFISETFNVAVENTKRLFEEHILPAFNTLRNEVLPPLIQGFTDLFGAIGGTSDATQEAKDRADGARKAFEALGFLVDVQTTVWKILGGAINAVVWAIRTTIQTYQKIQKWSEGVSSALGNVIRWFMDLPGKILRAVNDFPSLLWQAGRDLIAGLIRGVGSMIGNAVDAVKNVGSSMISGFKSMLGISSPSKVFEALGLDVTDGLVKGLRKGTAEAMAQVKDLGKQLVDKAKATLSTLRSDRSSMVSSVAGAFGTGSISGTGPDGALTTSDVVGGFAANASKAQAFLANVRKLKGLGLGGALLRRFIEWGPEAVAALAAGGAAAVASVKASDASIMASAGAIGDVQYGAAIRGARGDVRAARRVEQKISIIVQTPDAPGAGREIMKLIRQYRRASGDTAPA